MKSSLVSGKSQLSGRGIALVLALAILIPTAPREALARGGVFHLLSGAQAATITSPRAQATTETHSPWICTRNDVLGNLAVLIAAAGVFDTGTGWPDFVVAAIMATLALQGAWLVFRQSLIELRQGSLAPAE